MEQHWNRDQSRSEWKFDAHVSTLHAFKWNVFASHSLVFVSSFFFFVADRVVCFVGSVPKFSLFSHFISFRSFRADMANDDCMHMTFPSSSLPVPFVVVILVYAIEFRSFISDCTKSKWQEQISVLLSFLTRSNSSKPQMWKSKYRLQQPSTHWTHCSPWRIATTGETTTRNDNIKCI